MSRLTHLWCVCSVHNHTKLLSLIHYLTPPWDDLNCLYTRYYGLEGNLCDTHTHIHTCEDTEHMNGVSCHTGKDAGDRHKVRLAKYGSRTGTGLWLRVCDFIALP